MEKLRRMKRTKRRSCLTSDEFVFFWERTNIWWLSWFFPLSWQFLGCPLFLGHTQIVLRGFRRFSQTQIWKGCEAVNGKGPGLSVTNHQRWVVNQPSGFHKENTISQHKKPRPWQTAHFLQQDPWSHSGTWWPIPRGKETMGICGDKNSQRCGYCFKQPNWSDSSGMVCTATC